MPGAVMAPWNKDGTLPSRSIRTHQRRISCGQFDARECLRLGHSPGFRHGGETMANPAPPL